MPFRFVSSLSVTVCFPIEPFSECSSVRLGIQIERNIAIAEIELGKAIFHVSTILSLFEIGELGKKEIRTSLREHKGKGLTVKKAAGRCSSDQNSSGVSRVMAYGSDGDQSCVRPIP